LDYSTVEKDDMQKIYLLDQMKPDEIIQSVRAKDTDVIKALVHETCTVRKNWTQKELQEVLKDYKINLSLSTISRYAKGEK